MNRHHRLHRHLSGVIVDDVSLPRRSSFHSFRALLLDVMSENIGSRDCSREEAWQNIEIHSIPILQLPRHASVMGYYTEEWRRNDGRLSVVERKLDFKDTAAVPAAVASDANLSTTYRTAANYNGSATECHRCSPMCDVLAA